MFKIQKEEFVVILLLLFFSMFCLNQSLSVLGYPSGFVFLLMLVVYAFEAKSPHLHSEFKDVRSLIELMLIALGGTAAYVMGFTIFFIYLVCCCGVLISYIYVGKKNTF